MTCRSRMRRRPRRAGDRAPAPSARRRAARARRRDRHPPTRSSRASDTAGGRSTRRPPAPSAGPAPRRAAAPRRAPRLRRSPPPTASRSRSRWRRSAGRRRPARPMPRPPAGRSRAARRPPRPRRRSLSASPPSPRDDARRSRRRTSVRGRAWWRTTAPTRGSAGCPARRRCDRSARAAASAARPRSPAHGSRRCSQAASTPRRRRPGGAARPRQRSPIASMIEPGPVAVSEQVQPGPTGDVLDRASAADHLARPTRRRAAVRPGTARPEHGANLTGAPSTRAPTQAASQAEFVLAADERRVVAKWCRKGGAVARPDQRRVLLEDPSLEGSQLMARLEPELVTEHDAGPLVRGQGVVLTARRVQGAHQQRPRPFAARLLCDHALHLRHHGRRARPYRAAPRRDPPARTAAAPRAGRGRRPRSSHPRTR